MRRDDGSAQSINDPLTGCYSRALLGPRLSEELARASRSSTGCALFLFDVDYFKSVNDALGYAGGDRVLMELVSRLQSGTVAGEELYRLNGDEFALLGRCAPAECRARIRALQALTEAEGEQADHGNDAGRQQQAAPSEAVGEDARWHLGQ